MGGLSGKPLTKRSTEVISYIAQKIKPSFPIIGRRRHSLGRRCYEKLNAGASLVQLIYRFYLRRAGVDRKDKQEGFKVVSEPEFSN
jgi:dihydroorotate dehydrogenase